MPQTWAAFVAEVVPGPAAISDILALLGVAGGLALLGAGVGGKRRVSEIDVIVGWGAVCAIFTVLGVATGAGFTALAVTALIGAIIAGIAAYRRDGRLSASGLLRMAALALPAFLIVGAMTPTQWDELVHWLPNARYLVEYDRFPALDRPTSPSGFPGYPYGAAFVIYLASRLAGHLAENAGALFNVVLLLSFALLLLRIGREAYASDDGSDGRTVLQATPSPGWGRCALAILAVTALNPTFVPKIVFSAYGETATAVAVGASLALAWFALNALAGGDVSAARRHAWLFGITSAALVSVKQVNIVLFAAMLTGALVVSACDPRIKFRDVFKLLPGALIAPIAVYAAWRLHLAFSLPNSDFAVRPFAEWFWSLLPEIVGRMALIASKKGGYFAIMLVAVVLAALRIHRLTSAFDRLVVMTATLFITYNFFLLFTYVAAFGDYEAVRAASYWRYNMHLGGAALIFAVYGIVRLARGKGFSFLPLSAWRIAGAVTAVALFAAPIAFVRKFRFDLDPGYRYIRMVAADMAARLRPDHRLVAFDPKDNGQFLMLLRYGLHGSAQVIDVVNSIHRDPARVLRDLIDKSDPTHLWLGRPDQEAMSIHGLALAPGYSYLLARHDGAWVVERSWPNRGTVAQRASRE